jgi:hypothetical protein
VVAEIFLVNSKEQVKMIAAKVLVFVFMSVVSRPGSIRFVKCNFKIFTIDQNRRGLPRIFIVLIIPTGEGSFFESESLSRGRVAIGLPTQYRLKVLFKTDVTTAFAYDDRDTPKPRRATPLNGRPPAEFGLSHGRTRGKESRAVSLTSAAILATHCATKLAA